MLERLSIRDLALVERAELSLGAGLHAVTGETGAGKSLFVESLALLLGGRADSASVREGAKAAIVEGEFHPTGESAKRVRALLMEWGLEPGGDSLVLRREVSAEGRSRATVNQSAVTLASLRRLGGVLADLHGQHEHQSLLQEGAALLTLDRLGGLEEERATFAATLAALREVEGERARLEASLVTYAERRDYLMTAARELAEADLSEGEEEELRGEAARLAHADRLRELASQAMERLSEGEQSAADALGAASHATLQAAALDPSLEPALRAIEEAANAASEATRSLAHYLGALEADPAALEAVEARRETLARLQRRYRRDVTALLAWRTELDAELSQGENAEGALEHASARVTAAEAACRAAGQSLTRRRAAAAKDWSAKLTRELQPLGFPHARITFTLSPAPDAPQASGWDQVELAFAPNPGEPPRPLARIASGGELSRVMLALKCALQTRDRVDLLVFDEVDSGIGGAVAQAVGERLRGLAELRQVLCVTHLPVIAALASHHFAVSKQVVQGRTVARLEALSGAARVEELSRMLAGERVTDTTRRQARELLAAPGGRASHA